VAITDQLRQQADRGGVHYNPLHFWPHLTYVLRHLPAVAPPDQAGIDLSLPITGWQCICNIGSSFANVNLTRPNPAVKSAVQPQSGQRRCDRQQPALMVLW